MIRPARFGDVAGIVRLFQEGHRRSKYKDRAKIDIELTKKMLVGAIQRVGNRGAGGTCVFVIEQGEALKGFLLGGLDPVYGVCVECEAIAMYFYASPDVEPMEPARLLDAFVAWAKGNHKVIHIQAGVTDLIGDAEQQRRVEILYRRKGLKPEGKFFGMETQSNVDR